MATRCSPVLLGRILNCSQLYIAYCKWLQIISSEILFELLFSLKLILNKKTPRTRIVFQYFYGKYKKAIRKGVLGTIRKAGGLLCVIPRSRVTATLNYCSVSTPWVNPAHTSCSLTRTENLLSGSTLPYSIFYIHHLVHKK